METVVRLRLIPQNKRLVDARKERGWTQTDLALLIGIDQKTLSAIETLKLAPTPALREEIADALEKPVDYLFPESLLHALEADVFARRTREIGERHLMGLTEAKRAGLLPSPDGEETFDDLLKKPVLHEGVNLALRTLTPREAKIIDLLFGLSDGNSRTLAEVGKEFGVTRGRILQIEHMALRKLRHPSRSRKLKDFLD